MKTKTYYVLARENQNRFAPPQRDTNYPWVKTPQESYCYATVREVALNLANVERRSGGPLHIVRIEEMAGVETRRVLGEAESAREGETVKYALLIPGVGFTTTKHQRGTRGWDAGSAHHSVERAHLFDLRGQVTDDLRSRIETGTWNFYGILVERVAVSATPKITETVIQ